MQNKEQHNSNTPRGNDSDKSRPLQGKVAVVAGATRGAGRGIACMLGEAGATVYCTGRSIRGKPATAGRPETIEETADMVTSFGGEGIYLQVDHAEASQVKQLFEKVKSDHGQLDVLVNDIWGGESLTEWGTPFWELSLDKGFQMIDQATKTHLITSRYGVPLMVERGEGLVVEITDGNHQTNRIYRSNLFYDFVKAAIIRLAFGMAEELGKHGVTALAVTPGFLRSEAMLEHFGVTEENWQAGAEKDPHFIASESPFFVGRAVAALAADQNVGQKAGQALSSWELARIYGFTDMDGTRPDWEAHASKHFPEMFKSD